MADDADAATPVANVPNVKFYDSFTGVLWKAVGALAILLLLMAIFLVR